MVDPGRPHRAESHGSVRGGQARNRASPACGCEQLRGVDAADRRVDELDRMEGRQRACPRGAAPPSPGRGSPGCRSRRRRAPSRARARPCGRRARSRRRAARGCRCRRCRSRAPARPARRARGRGSRGAAARGSSASALGVLEVARVLVGDGDRQRVPVGAAARRLGEQLRDVDDRAAPPWSFRCEPQPAAFVTIASYPASARSSSRARATPSSSRPACACSAPQQPCARGTCTSNPSAASTRAVAALTSPKTTLWTQPARSATRGPGPGQVQRRPRRARPRRRDPAERPERPGRRRAGAARAPRAAGAGAGTRRRSARRSSRSPSAAARASLDVRAGLLDQPVVLHARGARGHAGHAAEAAVEVLDDRVRELERPVDERAHQVDAAARRVHLLVPERQ